MKLIEMFDSKTDWDWLSKTSDRCIAQIFIDIFEYRVSFTLIDKAQLQDQWGVTEPIENSWWVMFQLYSTGSNSKPIRDNSITGTGNEMLVFSNVIEIIKEFIKLKHPSALGFSASEPSRKSLYKKMVTRLAKDTKIYHSKDGETVFYIIL